LSTWIVVVTINILVVTSRNRMAVVIGTGVKIAAVYWFIDATVHGTTSIMATCVVVITVFRGVTTAGNFITAIFGTSVIIVT